jgi:glycosyltransferase involved in cell wall biosynthesis
VAAAQAPPVSVVVCTFNDERFIAACIDSVLAQTFREFELVVVDDCSTDRTPQIIDACADPRLRVIHRASNSGTIGAVRAFAVRQARGELLFFLDGDCVATAGWLAAGVAAMAGGGAGVIEGKIVYVREGYRRTFSDRVVSNLRGGHYMTANMVYRGAVLREHTFDPAFNGMEDRELVLRLKRLGHAIAFAPEMLVYHQQKTWTPRQYLREGLVRTPQMLKIGQEYDDWKRRVIDPRSLLLLFFPPLLLVPVLKGRVRTWADLRLLPFAWVRALLTRWLIWKFALTRRVLVL